MREIVKNNAWAARLIWGRIILALVLTAMFIAARLILRSEWGLNQIETHIEAMAPAGQSVQIDGCVLITPRLIGPRRRFFAALCGLKRSAHSSFKLIENPI